jgi:hypothetical protein
MSKFKSNEERMEYLNNKQNEIALRQEGSLVIDFDKALEEAQEDSISVKFMGKHYLVPSSMPFNFSIFFLRNCYKKVNGKMVVAVPDEHLVKFITMMFGNEFMVALENAKDVRVTMSKVFSSIVPDILGAWGYDIDTGKKDQKKIQTLTQEL